MRSVKIIMANNLQLKSIFGPMLAPLSKKHQVYVNVDTDEKIEMSFPVDVEAHKGVVSAITTIVYKNII